VPKIQLAHVFARVSRSIPEAISNFTGDYFTAQNAARNDIEIYVLNLDAPRERNLNKGVFVSVYFEYEEKTMKKIFLWNVLLFSILLTACGNPKPTPQPLPTLSIKWMVKMSQSGGFAGISRSIEISSDGAVTVKDERNGKIGKRQLTADELAKLTDLIRSASLKSPTGSPTECADCFIYHIEINSDGGKFTAQLDDVSLPDSGMKFLVGYLVKLMGQTLASG